MTEITNEIKLAKILSQNLSKSSALFSSISISSGFIFMLYALEKKTFNNVTLSTEHPIRAKSRIKSVLTSSLLAVIITGKLLNLENGIFSLNYLKIMGLNPNMKIQFISCLHSLVLISTLFLGPLLQEFLNSYICNDKNLKLQFIKFLQNIKLPKNNQEYWHVIKVLIIAPITEEITYRSCILPLLYKFYKPSSIYFIVPIFFGMAHIHHFYDTYFIRNIPLKISLIKTVFQFTYTTLFGAISTFVYYKTASLPAIILLHAFCNYMAFPNFTDVFYETSRIRKIIISGAYILGLGGFIYACKNLIKPENYLNNIF